MKKLISIVLLCACAAFAQLAPPVLRQEFTTNVNSAARGVVTNIANAAVASKVGNYVAATNGEARDLTVTGSITGNPGAGSVVGWGGVPFSIAYDSLIIDSLALGVLVLDSSQNPNVATIGSGLSYDTGTRVLSASATASSMVSNEFTTNINAVARGVVTTIVNGASATLPYRTNGFTTNAPGSTVNAAGSSITNMPVIGVGLGAVGAPSVAIGRVDTGFYSSAAGSDVRATVNGLKAFAFNSGGFYLFSAGAKVGFDQDGGGSNPYAIGKNGFTGVGLAVYDVFGSRSSLEVTSLRAASGISEFGGTVGIGTAIPIYKLHVLGDSYTTNGCVIMAAKTTAPSAPLTAGAALWSDGTNVCAVLRNAAGTLTTNKLSMVAWP